MVVNLDVDPHQQWSVENVSLSILESMYLYTHIYVVKASSKAYLFRFFFPRKAFWSAEFFGQH